MTANKLLKDLFAIVSCAATTGAGLVVVYGLLGNTLSQMGEVNSNAGAIMVSGFYLGFFIALVTVLVEPEHRPIRVLLSGCVGLIAVAVVLMLANPSQVHIFSVGGAVVLLSFGAFGALVCGCGFLAGSVCSDWLSESDED